MTPFTRSHNLTVPGPAFRLLIFSEIRLNPVLFHTDPFFAFSDSIRLENVDIVPA
jgi:hypothetical protein